MGPSKIMFYLNPGQLSNYSCSINKSNRSYLDKFGPGRRSGKKLTAQYSNEPVSTRRNVVGEKYRESTHELGEFPEVNGCTTAVLLG